MESSANNEMLEERDSAILSVNYFNNLSMANASNTSQSLSSDSVSTATDILYLNKSAINNLNIAVSSTTNTTDVNSTSTTSGMLSNVPQTDSSTSSTDEDDNKILNSGLQNLLEYGSSDSDTDCEGISDLEVSCKNSTNGLIMSNNKDASSHGTAYRENPSSNDSSSDYDSDSSSFSDIGACGGTPAPEKNTKKMETVRTKGELTLQDLPPIEDIQITVPEEECVEIGLVTSIIDQLVIVQSHKGTPAYDIDTLFFLNRGKVPFGRVFDVLGPVAEPLYAIRFNSYEQALATGVKAGTPVYCAPQTEHASLVFVSELMKMKGSDASWEHNNEPPDAFLDYSDDEEERQARRLLRKKTYENKSNSLERNKKFEKLMNDKNTLMNERFKSQPATSAKKKKPEVSHPPPIGPSLAGPPIVPAPWLLRNPAAPMARPDFWRAPPYQFAAYPPYGPMMFPPQQAYMAASMMRPAPAPPVFHPGPPQPYNPNLHPLMRPQPVSYFHKPRNPPWVPAHLNFGMLHPPRGNFGNGSSFTQ